MLKGNLEYDQLTETRLSNYRHTRVVANFLKLLRKISEKKNKKSKACSKKKKLALCKREELFLP